MTDQTIQGTLVGVELMLPSDAHEWVCEPMRAAMGAVQETGRRLLELKAGRLHGEWGPFVAALPFGERTAQAWMQIASHEVLGNPQYTAGLPADWTALQRLSQLDPTDVLRLMVEGDLTPATGQKDVPALLDKARGIEPDQADDWYTPRWLFTQLGVTFDMDVCAPVNPAHRTCPARRYITEQDNGLTTPWEGLIWCNPPYSAPAPWIELWANHDNGIILTHASVKANRMVDLWNAADTIRLFSGMHFDRPDGTTETPYWMIQLAARGPIADTLTRITDAPWMGPVWRPVDG